MRKKFLFMCLLSCSLLFAACGNKENQPQEQNPSEQETLNQEEEVVIQEGTFDWEEPVDLPDPEAVITLTTVDTTEGVELADSWNLDENGTTHLLTTSLRLVSLGLYKVDLSQGMEYDLSTPIVLTLPVSANDYISMTIAIPETDLPELMVVAEEPNGALGKYLLCFDSGSGEAYLVPVMD